MRIRSTFCTFYLRPGSHSNEDSAADQVVGMQKCESWLEKVKTAKKDSKERIHLRSSNTRFLTYNEVFSSLSRWWNWNIRTIHLWDVQVLICCMDRQCMDSTVVAVSIFQFCTKDRNRQELWQQLSLCVSWFQQTWLAEHWPARIFECSWGCRCLTTVMLSLCISHKKLEPNQIFVPMSIGRRIQFVRGKVAVGSGNDGQPHVPGRSPSEEPLKEARV